MRPERTLLCCLVVILILNFGEAMHLQGKLSDAATRTSKSLNRPGKAFFKNNNSFLKSNSFSEKSSEKGTDGGNKAIVNTRLGKFVLSSDGMHQHSDQSHTVLSIPKQSNQINKEFDSFTSSKVTKSATTHHPDTDKTIAGDNDVKEGKSSIVKAKSESKISADLHRNKEQLDLHEHKAVNNTIATKTLKSKVKSLSENDGVVVAEDDSNKLIRPKVTVFIEEKNTNGRTQRVIASNGNGVVQSRTVHIDDKSTHSKRNGGKAADDIINTDDSSNILDNNEIPPDIIEHNGAPAKEIEQNNIPANEIEHNDVSANLLRQTDDTSTVTDQSDGSSNVGDTENNEKSSRMKEHNTVSSNVSNNNGVSSDKWRHNDVSSNIEENNKVSNNKIYSNEIEPNNEELHEVRKDSLRRMETGHENSIEKENQTDLNRQPAIINSQTTNDKHQSKITPTMAVLENSHDNREQLKHTVKPAETTATNLRNVNTKGGDTTGETQDVPEVVTTAVRKPNEMTTPITHRNDQNDESSKNLTTKATPTVRKPEDVSPLNIFTSDIKYQRFPRPMSLTTLKNKVLGKPLKKLYILEESEKKLFQHVRQLEAIYTIEDGMLYVSFLFRFVYSRKCQEIKKFKMGKLVGNTDIAMFEKEMKDGKTERIMFFSERPEDYVFFMSCTDMMTSPYACRDSYYITLDTTRDPPNQFPWADAANELESKLSITFEDPRFIFNFVLLPCART